MSKHCVGNEKLVITTEIYEHFPPKVLSPMSELAHYVFETCIWLSDDSVKVPNDEQNILLGHLVYGVLELGVEVFGISVFPGRVGGINLDDGTDSDGTFKTSGNDTLWEWIYGK